MTRDETRPELPKKVALSLMQGTRENYWAPVIGEFNPDTLDRGHGELECVEYRPASDLAAAEARIAELKAALNRDKTGLALALETIVCVARGYSWISEGEWGSYSYEEQTEATLRREIDQCLHRIHEVAYGALVASGNLVNAAFNAPETIVDDRDKRVAELEPLAELAREIGEAWSASREAFRIIGKRGPLAHNEVMPSESEYAAINNRAYRSIDRAVELHRAAKEATCPK